MGRRPPWDHERAAVEIDAALLRRRLVGTTGLCRPGPPIEVVYDPRLTRRERRTVICHEIKHVQLNLFYDAETPQGVIDSYERIVRDHVADELIPMDELMDFVRSTEEAVTATLVAAEFDTTHEVADLQLRRLCRRWGTAA